MALLRKKILFISGTRSDFASIKNIYLNLTKQADIEARLFVTGPHTVKSAGSTYKDIEKSGVSIFGMKKIVGKDVTTDFAEETKAIGKCLEEDEYSAVVVTGDRPEMLAGSVAALYHHVPSYHIHGGDVTYGMIDDSIRHAITKNASIHFAATPLSAKRIRRMGEEAWRVFNTGSPDIDGLKEYNNTSSKDVLSKYGLPQGEYGILIFHPETLAGSKNYEYALEILKALETINKKVIIINPVSDNYSELILRAYKERTSPRYLAIPSLARREYLLLLKSASFLMGNSSSGIIEAATFGVSVINLGARQSGRQRNKNTIDVPVITKANILKAYNLSKSKKFKKIIGEKVNIYGRGDSGRKVANLIGKVAQYPKHKLLFKKFAL
jgi:GDP/UDP-N,N'-diacetylbacillosamine 2-epimerase (hydrolysing)